MAAIRAVKAGSPRPETTSLFADAAADLAAQGADLLIAGSSKVPLGLDTSASPARLIGPTTVLAEAVLRRVGAQSRLAA